MKLLRNAHTITDAGWWIQGRGFAVAEGPDPFGPVNQVHAPGSLHYKDQAFDVNYGGGGEWETEREALLWLYQFILQFRVKHPRWPLDEMFFDGRGYLKEYGPTVNHPITGHDTHLHIGWERKVLR